MEGDGKCNWEEDILSKEKQMVLKLIPKRKIMQMKLFWPSVKLTNCTWVQFKIFICLSSSAASLQSAKPIFVGTWNKYVWNKCILFGRQLKSDLSFTAHEYQSKLRDGYTCKSGHWHAIHWTRTLFGLSKRQYKSVQESSKLGIGLPLEENSRTNTIAEIYQLLMSLLINSSNRPILKEMCTNMQFIGPVPFFSASRRQLKKYL